VDHQFTVPRPDELAVEHHFLGAIGGRADGVKNIAESGSMVVHDDLHRGQAILAREREWHYQNPAIRVGPDAPSKWRSDV
jgi:hypothetical protein